MSIRRYFDYFPKNTRFLLFKWIVAIFLLREKLDSVVSVFFFQENTQYIIKKLAGYSEFLGTMYQTGVDGKMSRQHQTFVKFTILLSLQMWAQRDELAVSSVGTFDWTTIRIFRNSNFNFPIFQLL